MYVYFIQSGLDGPIKIGKAKNVNKRMETLQIGNPVRLKLIAMINCYTCKQAEYIEKQLHKKFKRYRLRGEWFSRKISFKDIRDEIEIACPFKEDSDEFKHMEAIACE